MIRLRDVSCTYEGRFALDGVTLDVRRGESIAILGPNGSGKSTLLKLINGIVLPESGRYEFDGTELTGARLKDPSFARRFHQRIGFLFQSPDTQLFCPTVRDDVAFGPRQMGLADEEVEVRVSDCMALLGIESLSSRAPWHLSEGEKRKVAFAGILSMNPDVLALDEPMNGIDPRTRRFLRELIVSLRAAGKTILCATHELASLDGIFRSAAVLSSDHRLVRAGPFDQVVSDRAFMEAHDLLEAGQA
ncbi:MAG: cobalt ABC transporter [Spirochaetes bacterium RBG_13_68_11]|nr:MAG: cobalt ABC transporter [Spirochaetes bacterium RBG_13_68_11]